MLRSARFASLPALLVIGACAANGPAFDETALLGMAVPEGTARILFFRTRDSKLYIARKAVVSVNREEIGALPYGSFLIHDLRAGRHRLRADMWDMPGQCELVITPVAGETYYFQVDPRSESFGASITGDLAGLLLTSNIYISAAGGVGAVAAESYGKECGGAFRIYPVNAEQAVTRLESLRLAD